MLMEVSTSAVQRAPVCIHRHRHVRAPRTHPFFWSWLSLAGAFIWMHLRPTWLPPPPELSPPPAGPPCPTVDGFAFHQLQNALGAFMGRVPDLPPTSGPWADRVAAMSQACRRASLCTAFTTWGEIKVLPSDPLLEVLDSSPASQFGACDGTYIRTSGGVLGLAMEASGHTRESLAAQGMETARNMAAAIQAARRVGGGGGVGG